MQILDDGNLYDTMDVDGASPKMAEMVGAEKVPWNNFNIDKLIGGSW